MVSALLHGMQQRLRAVLAALLLCALAVPAGATGRGSTDTLSLRTLYPSAEDIRTTSDLGFDVEYLAADERWAAEIIARSDAARRVLARATHDAFLVRVRIVIVPERDRFVELVGGWAENSVAVALPRARQVVLNAEALRRGAPADLGSTLIHEFAHLYVGTRCEIPLPRWMDEGIAMVVEGRWGVEESAALVLARTVNGLIPLRELERGFPVQADRQRLAYRQSHSVVRHIMRTSHSGSLPNLLRSLQGEKGLAEIERYWNPLHRDALELRWRDTLTLRSNWPLLVHDSGLMWGAGALLLVVAFVAVRMRRRRRHAEWDEEEKIYAVLDEEKEGIWGKDEDDLAPGEDDDEAWRGDDDRPRPPWYGGGSPN